jgi:Rne/Rng family ribonuclease
VSIQPCRKTRLAIAAGRKGTMAKEICISSTPHETRLAILEDDQLAEIYYERENEYTLAGSIYNGRVTRVLPGMQSAFVDIGLERDAFLYVTDFLELEDQEESDELERAASSPTPPREVRHGGDRNGQRSERAPREQQPAAEGEATEVTFAVGHSEPEKQDGQDTGEPGAKRWRGRRRRRGGRAGTGPQTSSSEGMDRAEGEAETSTVVEIRQPAEAAVPPRSERTQPSVLLPGESLSKYGGTPAERETKPRGSAGPVRPAVTSRPSTLVEAPLRWDGSGLLPGESLSRHRKPEPAAEVHGEPEGTFADAESHSGYETVPQTSLAMPVDEELVEETLVHEGLIEEEAPEAEPSEVVALAAEEAPEAAEEHAIDEPEGDADASHHVDPLPPSTFRLFGLGGNKKKKSDEESAPEQPLFEGAHEALSHHEEARVESFAADSSFAPGSGVVEEELIEGEEFETPLQRPHHKLDEHDLDEYEEETLQTQIRSGDLGEMLQEAHLDHRIQMDFDDKSVEEDEEDIAGAEEEEEEPAAVEGQPAAEGQPQPRRDRGGRGRRGRGGHRPGDRRGQSRRAAQTSDLPIISDLLKPGQEILVQIAKEPIAKKGARITSHIALPGRFLVFMPTVTHVGVSRKISSDEERQRLKRILIHERGESSGGFIVRTAAEGASEEELRADLRFLIHLWNEIKQRSEGSKSPALIYHDLSLIERILRDQVSANFSSIWVDSEADYERIVRFLNRFSPSLVRRVKLYTKETPLFEHFGIQDEISKALRSKVWLKSGGSIVINQTEALVAIDINTGKYVGKTARLEDTIVKTNLDAIPEIVRQIRLRDLGGIIIIDFIDMDERKNRFKVMAALEEALKNDRAPTKVLQFNDFGLVAITRKRVKQSLERTLSVPCPICQATGMVKSSATVCNEIYIELRKMRKNLESGDVLLRVNPETVKALKANNARWLTDFEELTGKNILVKSDPALHPEQFDIQG